MAYHDPDKKAKYAMKRVDRFVGHAGLDREIVQGDGIRYTQARIAPAGTIFSRLPFHPVGAVSLSPKSAWGHGPSPFAMTSSRIQVWYCSIVPWSGYQGRMSTGSWGSEVQ